MTASKYQLNLCLPVEGHLSVVPVSAAMRLSIGFMSGRFACYEMLLVYGVSVSFYFSSSYACCCVSKCSRPQLDLCQGSLLCCCHAINSRCKRRVEKWTGKAQLAHPPLSGMYHANLLPTECRCCDIATAFASNQPGIC